MSSLGPSFRGLLQNFFSWLARLFYDKERKPDCEEQIGLPTRVVFRKKMSLDATSATSKNRQGIQGRLPHPGKFGDHCSLYVYARLNVPIKECARQNVCRHPSSKRKAVYDAQFPRKRRPAIGSPLVQFDPIPQRFSHRIHATPIIRIEDWSILPPRKCISQRLSFITAPTRALRLPGFISNTQPELLAVPATDSSGHWCSPSLSRTGRFKHVNQRGSEPIEASISKPALPSDLCGCPDNERRHLDVTQPKIGDNKPRHPHTVGGLFMRELHVTSRKTTSAFKPISKRPHSELLPAAGFSSLLETDGQAEQGLRVLNELERAGQGSKNIADDPVAPAIPFSIDSTLFAKAHEKLGSPTTIVTDTHDSQSFFGLGAPAKQPYADFGDVPYPFVFNFDFYLPEAEVPTTPLLLASFPGLGSEFSSPATDYFDTPTPSPKRPIAPLLMQPTNISGTAHITCETPDSSRPSGDLALERSIQESLDNSGMVSSLHSSGVEDISSSQSEYSIPSTDDVNDSITSSDLGKPIGDDLDKPILNKIDGSSHGSSPPTGIKTMSSESRLGGGSCLPEKVIIDVYSTSDEDGAGIMNETLASLEYPSCTSTDKSCGTGSESENAATETENLLTMDEPAFCTRHRRLLENLSFSVSNKKQLRSSRKDSPDRSTSLKQSIVASVVPYPTVPRVSSTSIDRNDRVTGPIKPLTPVVIPTVGVSVGEKMMRWGIKGFKGGFERERPNFSPVGQVLGGVGRCGIAELHQATRRKVMPEKF